MPYLVFRNGIVMHHTRNLNETKKAVTGLVAAWRKAPRHTAVKRRDPDSPIGYRYALKARGQDVGYVSADFRT